MYQVVNIMEQLIDELFDELFIGSSICQCEKCQADIRAIALNNLPAKYYATDKGEIFYRTGLLRQQFRVDIITALTDAAETVRQHPQHNGETTAEFRKE